MTIAVDRALALQTADGKNNYMLALDSESTALAAKIGDLRISDGQAHVVFPTLKADFVLSIAAKAGIGAHGD